MAHYDILAFVNDLFWISLFFSFFFFMIDEFFLKKYCELTILKHYIYIENAWVKVYLFNTFFLAYFSFLHNCYTKISSMKWASVFNVFAFLNFSGETFGDLTFDRFSREKILKKFKIKQAKASIYFKFFVFFLAVW